MTLQDLLSIKSEKQFRTTCNDYLSLIGKGSSRNVYRLNSKQVIKVAKSDWGYTQNASECDTFKTYGGLGLFNEIIKNADNYLWVIQPLATPISNDNVVFNEIVKLIQSVEKSKEYTTDDVFLQKFHKFLIDTKWKFLQDFSKIDSWGIVNNELRILDYGMNNEAYEDYFKFL
jgi:hypothetical protein